MSKKARSVVKTSLDLGRQYEGSERFASYSASRLIVRNVSSVATFVNNTMPSGLKKRIDKQFDERPFIERTAGQGKDAPVFDMLRASVTLVVSSILIAVGTNLKLPLSTTYVTFMVFMGASLADGAWGRDSAVFRVSGVLSVIGGWFFTAFSAFTVAFIVANIFYFGGPIAIVLVVLIAAVFIFRTHKYHQKRIQSQVDIVEEFLKKKQITRETVIDLSADTLSEILGGYKNDH